MRVRSRWVLGFLLLLLLTEVLVEAWVVTVTGSTAPKLVKNGLYIVLIGLTAVRIHRERRWREFRSPADLAFLLLVAVLLTSSLIARVPMVVVAQAIFVYLRGVIVFYAVRALQPSRQWIRAAALIAGVWLVLNAMAAVAQIVVGTPGYTVLGWTDLSAAGIHRAQGFFEHPNDLGHVLGLALLGIFGYLTSRGHKPAGVWFFLAVVGAGLAATQSRESLLGVGCGLVLIAFYRGLPLRRVVVALLVTCLLAALPIALLPGVRQEATRRAWGVASALGLKDDQRAVFIDPHVPVCAAHDAAPTQTGRPGSPCRHQGDEREIRIVFAQQGIALWRSRPLLGYGAGTFGGVVALENDPNWNLNPRFGPGGFDLQGFHGKTVDSFWLHLLVEAGALGLLVYLGWLVLLCLPLWLTHPKKRRDGAGMAAFGLAGIAFGVVIAFLSPSLESPIVPPLLYGILGLAWLGSRSLRVSRPTAAPMTEPSREPATTSPG